MNFNNIFLISLISISVISGCKKNEETPPATNIATEVVANLAAISANYSPNSLDTSTSGVQIKSDPCQGVSDFATCQSNLIREYNKIGKSVVDTISGLAGNIGGSLGQLADGSTGTSEDGKISWNKASSTVWSVIARGAANASEAYFSINGGTYTLKIDETVDSSTAKNQKIEASVTFNSSNSWSVDVFFSNLECDAADPGAPNKFHLKLNFDGTLWTGKAMLYFGRWKAPGATVTCATGYGTSEITMYTDYVGNDDSTKASLYLIPAATADLTTIGNFDMADFCTHFASACDGPGEPTAVYLAGYANPWCTTGPGTAPTWGNTCPANTAVTGASYSNANLWTMPNALKIKDVTLPTSL